MTTPEIAIRVEGMGKLYRIGVADEYHDSIVTATAKFLKSPFKNYRKYRSLYDFRDVLHNGAQVSNDVIWALKDVSFEVRHGEVLGIIGPNGSGKSTLLKILSRITPPSKGRATIHGRVGSLLEVGTGFHPELTGRENIYLNGTVLGMTRKEVARNLDEIIDFSGVEQFLDTPVKRYSSGMRVRLAFSVAAHLQPEVLIIDEVLAVGDSAFQEKCLGKMRQIASSGRTVLFVSHNLPAVKALCSRAILLDRGVVWRDGSVDDVIDGYLAALQTQSEGSLAAKRDHKTGKEFQFTQIQFLDPRTMAQVNVLESGQPLLIQLHYNCSGNRSLHNVGIEVGFLSTSRGLLFHCKNKAVGASTDISAGAGHTDCYIPRLPLKGGRYIYDVYAEENGTTLDCVINSGMCEVVDSDYYGTGFLPAPGFEGVLIDYSWRSSEQEIEAQPMRDVGLIR